MSRCQRTILSVFAATLGLSAGACVAGPMSDGSIEDTESADTAVVGSPYAFTRSGTGAVNWAACGSEYGSCQMLGAPRAVVRYGVPGNYFYFGTEGMSSVPCSNFGGDPAWKQDKFCDFTTSLSIPPSFFANCASEGGSCNVGPIPVWVRYGVPGQWYDTVQSGTVSCSNDFFHVDPARGATKLCQVGSPVKMDRSGFQTCAAEGQTCSLPSTLDGVLLRYGAGTNWTYRLADTPSLRCSNDVFQTDPFAGAQKFCQFVALPAKAGTTGAWNQGGSCTGCKDLTLALSWGTQRTQTQSTTDAWSQTVTASMEAGFDLDGVGAKVSTSVASTYAHSVEFSNALTTSYGATVTADCHEELPGERLAIYQFSTSTDAACVRQGGCAGHTYTTDFLCVHSPPPGYPGPSCAPSDCADAICQTCASSAPSQTPTSTNIGVYRSYSAATAEHFYTTDYAEATFPGFQLEASTSSAYYYSLRSSSDAGLQPLYRCNRNGRRLYTVSPTCEASPSSPVAPESSMGYISSSQIAGTTPLFRAYNAANGDHFYTIDAGELQSAVANAGYVFEAIIGYVWPATAAP